jgi:CelD/BcsL family acetyltransferase involved in cellulose biosynthesis
MPTADVTVNVGAAPSAGAVTAHITSGLDHVGSLEREWQQLFAASETEPTASWEWTQALARTQLDSTAVQDSCVVQLRRGEVLVGVVPLIVRTAHVFGQRHRVLRPLAELKNTHSDLLVSRDPEVVAALFRALRTLPSRWDSFRLSKLLEGHVLTDLLERTSASLGCTPRRRFRKAAYVLPLPQSLDDYLALRSSKFRNYARRAEKKLRRAGRVEQVDITTPGEFDAGFDALLHVERQSWKHAHGTAISAVPREAALYRHWGRAAAALGHVHLQLLMLDGEPIAHNLGCLHRGTYYYLKTSYAARHRPLSPATFLRLALVERMIARGLSAIDFCGTPYEWEQQWTEEYRWHHVLSIYANTWRGRMFSMLDRWTHYSSSGGPVQHADARSQRP